MNNNNEEPAVEHLLRRWVSVGDVIVMVTSLLVLGVMWGSISRDVDRLSDEVQLLRESQREITPGAENRIIALESRAAARDRELMTMREDSAQFRAEVRQSLQRIEDKLDNRLPYRP